MTRHRKRPQAQKPRGRNLPTSGFGLHGGTLRDLEDKEPDWVKELGDEITNWKDYV